MVVVVVRVVFWIVFSIGVLDGVIKCCLCCGRLIVGGCCLIWYDGFEFYENN